MESEEKAARGYEEKAALSSQLLAVVGYGRGGCSAKTQHNVGSAPCLLPFLFINLTIGFLLIYKFKN